MGTQNMLCVEAVAKALSVVSQELASLSEAKAEQITSVRARLLRELDRSLSTLKSLDSPAMMYTLQYSVEHGVSIDRLGVVSNPEQALMLLMRDGDDPFNPMAYIGEIETDDGTWPYHDVECVEDLEAFDFDHRIDLLRASVARWFSGELDDFFAEREYSFGFMPVN